MNNLSHISSRGLAILAVTAFIAMPGLAQAQQHSGTAMSPPAGQPAMPSNMEHGSMEMMKSMEQNEGKMKSMQMKGKTDHDFAEMMRMHHQAGIDMAQIQMKHGKDLAMKKMAQKIVTAQKKEVKEFDQWLQSHK